MKTCFAAVAATAALLMVALLIPTGAHAGASASAPSKYSNTNQTKQAQANRQNFPITEYSSSSRNTSQKH